MKTIVPKQRTVVKWGVGTFGEEVCRPELDRRLYSLLNSILVHPGGLRAGRGPGITSVLAWASLILCCLALTNSSFMGGSILQNFWAQGLVEWSVPPFPAQDLCQDNVSYLLLGCLSPGSALGQWPILRPPSLWSSHSIYTRPLMPAAPFCLSMITVASAPFPKSFRSRCSLKGTFIDPQPHLEPATALAQ